MDTATSMKPVESIPSPRFRLIGACIVALAIMGASMLSAWISVRHGDLEFTQCNRWQIRFLAEQVEQFSQRRGHWPASLVEIERDGGESLHLEDPWGRPYQFEIQGDQFDLISLGQDGKSGGYGFDADIRYRHQYPPEASIPFLQFFLHVDTRTLWMYSFASGLMAGVSTYRTLGRDESWGRLMTRGLAVLIPWTICTVLVAIFMAMSEYIPNGH